MQLKIRSIRDVLSNNRGFSLVDMLVGIVVVNVLGMLLIGAVAAARSGWLGAYLAAVAGLAGLCGIGAYSFNLWKKTVSARQATAAQYQGR